MTMREFYKASKATIAIKVIKALKVVKGLNVVSALKAPIICHKSIAVTSVCLLFLCPYAMAQEKEGSDALPLADVVGLWATDDNVDEASLDDWYDQISSLAEQHININTATYEQLLAIPFLSSKQIDAIGEHIARYGFISSAAELLTIPELDRATATMLGRIIDFGKIERPDTISLKNRLSMARQEAVVTGTIPFYTTYGDQKAYLGPRYKHSLRYKIELNNHFEAGLVASQDAGEPFFAGRNRWGYDHYSPYIIIYGRRFLSTLAIGNYRLRMGMGLVINNGFSLGKSSWQQQATATRQSIRPHSSRSAANYMQGVATEMRLSQNLRLTLFASSRLIDATPTTDGTAIRTILTSGYHRTQTEMDHKHNARQSAAGTNLRFCGTRWHVGLTALASHLSKRLSPDKSAAYRKYRPEGTDFFNASVDYAYRTGRFSFEGETATGSCRGIATINSLMYSPATYIDLMLSLRHYSKRYSSLFANAFGNQSMPQNESGALFGMVWNINSMSILKLYTDIAYSPRPRYGISAASSQWDTYLNLTRYTSRFVLTALYRIQLKQQNNDAKTHLVNYTEQRLRLRMASSSYGWFNYYLQADASMSTKQSASRGLMLSAMASAKPTAWLRLKAIGAWFHTDDYYSRLYICDGGILYSMQMAQVYGHGMHASLLATASLTRRITLTALYSATKYFDRDTIGSSYSRIDGSLKSSLELQLIWRLPQKSKR